MKPLVFDEPITREGAIFATPFEYKATVVFGKKERRVEFIFRSKQEIQECRVSVEKKAKDTKEKIKKTYICTIRTEGVFFKEIKKFQKAGLQLDRETWDENMVALFYYKTKKA